MERTRYSALPNSIHLARQERALFRRPGQLLDIRSGKMWVGGRGVRHLDVQRGPINSENLFLVNMINEEGCPTQSNEKRFHPT
jgi:hypothetical protein